jgi:hypothetical protein
MLGAIIWLAVPSPHTMRPLPTRAGGIGQPGFEKSRSEWHSKHIVTDSARYFPCSRLPLLFNPFAALGTMVGAIEASAATTITRKASVRFVSIGILPNLVHLELESLERKGAFLDYLQNAAAADHLVVYGHQLSYRYSK